VDTLSNAVTVADDGGCTPAGLNLNCSAGTLLAGERVTYTIVVTANSAVAAGALVTNSVTVASGTADPDLTNNHGAAATRVDRAAALAVSKSAQPSPVTAGQLVTYTVLVTNSGPSDAANVTVYDLLPAGFSHVSSVADGGAFCLGSGCTFASVPAGATRTITLAAADCGKSPGGGAVDNVVHVSATVAAPAVFTATTFVNIAPSHHAHGEQGGAEFADAGGRRERSIRSW
jgi:uncharacterized repeat protein (TIGR01451 family)